MSTRILFFEAQKAEDEPWLSSLYIPPPGSEGVLRSVHTVVFAHSGQGKTALARIGLRQGEAKGHFLLDWAWPSVSSQSDLRTIITQLFQALEQHLFRALLTHLRSQPQHESRLADWQRAYLAWLGEQMPPPLPWEPVYPLWQRLRASVAKKTAAWTASFATLSLEQRIPPLIYVFQALGFQQVWVVVDDVKGHAATPDIRHAVTVFFQTLAFFDLPLVYKIFLPASWEPFLARTAGPARSRVHVYRLRWTPEALETLVNRRLQALHDGDVTLDSLCQDPAWFRGFLLRAGGENPREWLRLLAPVVKAWQETGYRPLPSTQVRDIWLRHPPPLRMDDVQGLLWVGGRPVPYDVLPERGLEMLRYLWERAGQVVSVAEIYRAIYGAPESPGLALESRQIMDTLIWRVRKAIEPDPKHPVLLLRRRGQGLQLNVRW